MKKILIISASILNLNYFFSWIFIFNKYDNQIDRRNNFLENWLIFDNINTLDISLSLLTVISIILIFSNENNNKYLRIICFIINVLFLIFMIWAHL